MKVWFYPQRPGTWAKIHVLIKHLGWTYGTESDHDIRALFSNRTIDKGGVILDRKGRRKGSTTHVLPKTINGGCVDVTKSRTDAVFTQAFGYSSLVSPVNTDCVEKTEVQAVKGIREVRRGSPRQPGHIYQRKIETRNKRGEWVEFRPMLIGHKIFRVTVKRKTDWVHGDATAKIDVVPPSHVFSREEIAKIQRMSELFGSDFADFDVLRDRSERRLYVVDVNYTAHRNAFDAVGRQLGENRQMAFLHGYAKWFSDEFTRDVWRVR
jgi:hypothetical protein